MLKIARFFLERPYQEFYLRETATKLNLSPFAVKQYADYFTKKGILIEERKANLRHLKLNTASISVKQMKILLNIYEIENSKLVEFIREKVPNVSAAVLFGSCSRGENDEKSDIDILVIGKKCSVNLDKFEKSLKRTINLHLIRWSEWVNHSDKNKAFYLDIITQGIVLFGEKPIVHGNQNN